MLSLLWLGLLLWHGFDPWPRKFCMTWVGPKKKKKVSVVTISLGVIEVKIEVLRDGMGI